MAFKFERGPLREPPIARVHISYRFCLYRVSLAGHRVRVMRGTILMA